VEATETTYDQAFAAVGRAIASEGFLGLTTNKDIGVISAYQEDNGKKSSISAVVSEAAPGIMRVEATFSLARGLRSPTGAVRDYLCKIVEAAVSPKQKAALAEAAPGVFLRDGDNNSTLAFTVGEFRKAGFGPVMVLFFDFPGARASTRSSLRRPALFVRSDRDPSKDFLWVRCDTDRDDDRRSVKLGSAGSLLKMGVTGKGDLVPDQDWTLPFSATAEADGYWRLTPNADLVSGEYGLWDAKGYGVALFGVD
jgi:hypothetical protein